MSEIRMVVGKVSRGNSNFLIKGGIKSKAKNERMRRKPL